MQPEKKNSQTDITKIMLAMPRGFCAGVERAIETVRLSLKKYGPPVYILHEIVHNRHVLEELENLGAVFVEHLTDIPTGGICIFSAHGVSRDVESRALDLCLKTIDATCPLVGSVHRMVEKYHADNYDVFIIGHHNHPEVEGTAGRVSGRVHIISSEKEASECYVEDDRRVAYVTQTTLSVQDIAGILGVLRERFPLIKGPASSICFATQNRQNAVKKLAAEADLILVVGSMNSSNSNRLREVALRQGTPCHLIDDRHDIQLSWLEGVNVVGITAGASAPERLVEGVIDWLREKGGVSVQEMSGSKENIHFEAAERVD